MTTLELRTQPASPVTRWSGSGFGLVLQASEPFPGLPPTAAAGQRVTSWREVAAQEVEGAWRLGDGEMLLERRHPDGRLFLQIDSDEQDGFRIWAPYYGRHLVAPDGCSITSALPRVPPVRWQRLFFEQVLPLSAALQGLSLFHASAVAVRGKVLPFIGPSGSGKTSLTAHLVALGASFFTDDVLVVESGPAGPRASGPGAPKHRRGRAAADPFHAEAADRAVRRPQRQVDARARALRLATPNCLPLLLAARLRRDSNYDQRR